MPSTTQVEWLNENALRAYPFAENSTRIPNGDDGPMGEAYALPNYLFVDVLVTLPYMELVPELFVSSVTLAGGVFTAVVSAYDPDGDSSSVIGSVSSSTSVGMNAPIRFVGSGDYDGAQGVVVLGDLSRFSASYPDGVFTFDRSQTTLETRCVRPSVRCVTGLRATNGSDVYSTKTLYGDVALVAGTNVRLTYMPSVNGIRIDVDSNSGYNDKCSCDGSDSVVRTINGISVSDVTIEGGDCISVETSQGRITISDTCSKPCCGCEELNFVNTKTNELVTASSRLSSFISTLNSRLEDFKTNFLESERSPIKVV